MQKSKDPKKHVFFQTSGGEIYEGCNVGDYPKHHFSYTLLSDLDRCRPFYVVLAGDDENNRGFWRHRPNSQIFSIELVVDGEFLLTQNGEHFHCGPGTVFFVHRNQNVRMECLSEYALKRTIIMDGPMLYSILSLLGLDHHTCQIQLTDPEKIDVLFQKMGQLCSEHNSQLNNQLCALAYQILLELQIAHLRRKQPKKLTDILNVLDKYTLKPINLEQIAEEAGISRRVLFELFSKYLGTTPLKYLTERRIEYAKLLLRENKCAIKEIASDCGYSDPHYFSRDFHKQTGITPAAYRKSCLEKDKTDKRQ